MSDIDYGFSLLLGKTNAPPPDARYPFARAYVTAEVKSFILLIRGSVPTRTYYPGVNADNATKHAVLAYLEAGSWLHAANNDPELIREERIEWRMNAAVLIGYAELMKLEAEAHEARARWYSEMGWS